MCSQPLLSAQQRTDVPVNNRLIIYVISRLSWERKESVWELKEAATISRLLTPTRMLSGKPCLHALQKSSKWRWSRERWLSSSALRSVCIYFDIRNCWWPGDMRLDVCVHMYRVLQKCEVCLFWFWLFAFSKIDLEL